MAHRSRRRIYETAFDSKVEKQAEEGSGDLLDRIANHPILLLLNPRRRSRTSHPSSPKTPNNNRSNDTLRGYNLNDAATSTPTHLAYRDTVVFGRGKTVAVLPKSKFQGSGTPRCGRRGARARISPPTRSLSSHHLIGSSLRPIGLSKSDDQILNRVSDSPDDDDCLDGYVEGRQAEDMARDLITLHLSAEEVKANERKDAANNYYRSGEGQRLIKESHYKMAGVKDCPVPYHRVDTRGERLIGGDGKIKRTDSYTCSNDNTYSQCHCSENSRNKHIRRDAVSYSSSSPRSSSILALHHPNVSSPRLRHHGLPLSNPGPQCHSSSNVSSPRVLRNSAISSPRFSSHSASSSPKVYHSNSSYINNSSNPRWMHATSAASPKLPYSALCSPRLQHIATSVSTDSTKFIRSSRTMTPFATSSVISNVLQGTYDCNSSPSIDIKKITEASHEPCSSDLSIDKAFPIKFSLRELERSAGLAKLKPLELHTPPGTAPLPIKFIKKTPLSDRSPSSWFDPPRQTDHLSLPMKCESQSRSSSSDASTSEGREQSRGTDFSCKSRSKKSSRSSAGDSLRVNLHWDLKQKSGLCTGSELTDSQSSLNSSLEVLVDPVSESGLSLPTQANVKTSSFSLDSMVSVGSSMDSLKSSMSEGCKSVVEGAGKDGWRNMGSNTSLPLRPSLLLPASHRSLIQSAKFQILSPISDKSQEPSSSDTGGPIVGGMGGFGLVGGGSQRTSPQDLLQQTPVQPRNIHEDFRNVHHILPGPPPKTLPSASSTGQQVLSNKDGSCRQPGSDSGISIEYAATQQRSSVSSAATVLKDLPFDMPKLRRRLAAARSCPSTSNSSLTSSGERNVSTGAAVHPAISRVAQVSDGRSGTSSSNSSDWDVRSASATSSNEGTPKKLVTGRGGLALDLGCSAIARTGEKVDVSLPLTKQHWYHGNIDRSTAEGLLRSEGEGTYLVRSIDTPRKEYSLALKAACGFMHLKIHYHTDGDGFRVGRGEQMFPSVPHIIHHHSIHRLPIKGAEHMFLVKPIISETL